MAPNAVVAEAVLDALDSGKHPAKAEQVFYLLKALQTKNSWGKLDVVSPMAKLREHFSVSTIHSSLKKLEELGLIRRNLGEGLAGHFRSRCIYSIELLKEDASVPMGKRGPKPGSKKVPVTKAAPAKETLVFLDENEFIRAKLSGISFRLGEILDRLSKRLGCNPARVFIYISEKTELRHFKELRELYASGRAEVRYIKTESLPGEVDRRMRDDISLWSRSDAIGRIVLGTADGGPEFQSAIRSAKEHGKEVMLLEAAGVFNESLLARADERINVTAQNPLSEEFKGLVTEIRLSKRADRRNQNVKFIAEVAVKMHSFLLRMSEARFMKILNAVWEEMRMEWSSKGYSSDDAKSAIMALVHQGYALRWDKSTNQAGGREIRTYWLREQSDVMDVLTGK
ncbi:MAG: NYN domain-containing protein [Patescibacteria group bacterium]|nr:NYN domain-containing protein [Patescibacteria group bacterium]